MKYNVDDCVKFYVDLSKLHPVTGEIIDVNDYEDTYMILYEGSRFKVHERFVVEKCPNAGHTSDVLNSKILYYKDQLKKANDRIEKQSMEIHSLRNKLMICGSRVELKCGSHLMEQ